MRLKTCQQRMSHLIGKAVVFHGQHAGFKMSKHAVQAHGPCAELKRNVDGRPVWVFAEGLQAAG